MLMRPSRFLAETCFINVPNRTFEASLLNSSSVIADIVVAESLMDGIIDKVTAHTQNISIGDCLDCYSSTLQEGETEEQGKHPVYGANGVCGYLDYATISAPAILVVKDGSGVGNVLYTNGDCSVVGTLNYLQPKKGVSAKFLYFVLKRFLIFSRIKLVWLYRTFILRHILRPAYSVPNMKNNREQRHPYLA